MKLLKKLFGKKEKEPKVEESDSYTLTIWSTVDGPFQDLDGIWTVLVKAPVDGDMIVTELYFEDMDSGYKFCTDLLKHGGPMDLELPSDVKVLESDFEWQKKQQ